LKEVKKGLEERWQSELSLVKRILEFQEKLETKSEQKQKGGVNTEALSKELERSKKQLESLQGEETMVPICVDSGVIASVISGWTGIPVGKMLTDEVQTILTLKQKMEQRIIGQSQALEAICRRIQTYRANLDDPGKPTGVFLAVGPSGVGKTETAVVLSEFLYGGERNMTVINMSEYQEAYTVSGLKGSPPGYVGYGKGGVLTEAVRHNPFSIVLLDEVEKAHPDVMELFYQVFDKGIMEDAEGVVVDFKNTIILLTSNVGSEVFMRACQDPENLPNAQSMIELIRPTLLKYFKPALLGRLVIVPYYPLGDREIRTIAKLKLATIEQRFMENHRVKLSYGEELIAAIAARCKEVDTGARNVDHIITNTLLPKLSGELLKRMAVDEPCTSIHIYLDRKRGFVYKSTPSSPLLHSVPEKKRSSLLYDRSSLQKGGKQKGAVKMAEAGPKKGGAKRSGSWLDFFKK
jgi:type VI secretion system protein VasG